ncbi:MAG: hypothetical protein ABR586_09880, partial [Thermoplasmatota archaeon]
MHKLAALLVALPLLAGCLSAPTDPQRQAAQALAQESVLYDAVEAKVGAPIGEEGNLPGVPDQVNLARLAALTGQEGRTPQAAEGYVETAVKGGYAYLCRTGPEQGLVIFDVHDPAHPTYVSELPLDAGFEADIEVSDDGHWGFWETQRQYLSVPGVPDPTSPGSILPHGISILDLSDKAHPRWAGFQPVAPDGPHSITYANVNGRHLVLLSCYAFAYAYEDVEVPKAQRLEITELDTSTPVPTLKLLASYVEPGAEHPPPGVPGNFPHDVSVSVHPITH